MQDFLVFLFFLHGAAHLPGIIVPWRITAHREVPYKSTLFAGRFRVQKKARRLLGFFWLVTSLAFIFTAIVLFIQMPWWKTLAYTVTLVSALLCISEWPEVKIGLALDIAILILLLFFV